MVACTIRYILPEGTDWSATRELLQQRAQLYEAVPGLISKAFLYNPATREYGGNYVWTDREALHAFLESELFRGAMEKFGKPEIHVAEIAAYLDRGMIHLAEDLPA